MVATVTRNLAKSRNIKKRRREEGGFKGWTLGGAAGESGECDKLDRLEAETQYYTM